MPQDMNESVRIVIGNVLQVIVFLYCQNDEWIFRALSFIWYLPVLSDGTSKSVIHVKRYVSRKCLYDIFYGEQSVQLEPKLGKSLHMFHPYSFYGFKCLLFAILVAIQSIIT